MKTLLTLPPGLYEGLLEHLLPPNQEVEEAAFVLASVKEVEGTTTFEALEAVKLQPDDFVAQYEDYLELGDATRTKLIKRAHDLNGSIVELHSHVSTRLAEFSWSDRIGLKETVAHMRWRLSGRPYAAIVFARQSFDALVWLTDRTAPMPLNGLLAGDRLLQPTNRSFENWI